MVRAILQNVSPKDLSIHLIDSDKGRMAHIVRLIREVLPDLYTDRSGKSTNLIEITESQHPEVLRRELEKKTSNESSRFSARKYNIVLARTKFDDFNQVVPNDHGHSFDGERSVKNMPDHKGVLKMLIDYWKLLTNEGSQFFTSFFVDSPEKSKPRLDQGEKFDDTIHILNLPEPLTDSPKENVVIPKLQYMEGDNDNKNKANLSKMFEYFDFVASLKMSA